MNQRAILFYSTKGQQCRASIKFYRLNGKIYISSKPREYRQNLKTALHFRLHEFDAQVNAVRQGLGRVLPLPLLSLFTGPELEAMVCGSPELPLALLKSVTTYKGVEPTSSPVRWFWQVMEEYSHVEPSLFLRFALGRTPLPRTLADFRGRDFVLRVLNKYVPAD